MNIEHSEITYPNFQRVEARIAAGEIIVYGRPDLLLIDLDSEDAFQEFLNRREFSQNVIVEAHYHHRKSPSGRGYHVFIQLPAAENIATRIAMQAALGSDFKRDLLSLHSVTTVGFEVQLDSPDYKVNPIFLLEKDADSLPEWVITKSEIRRQRAEWVRNKARQYGLEVAITVAMEPTPAQLSLSGPVSSDRTRMAAIIQAVDRSDRSC